MCGCVCGDHVSDCGCECVSVGVAVSVCVCGCSCVSMCKFVWLRVVIMCLSVAISV